MKAPTPWQFLSIYLLIIGSVGCVLLSLPVGLLCAMRIGCYGNEIVDVYISIIVEAWPKIVLFLIPFAIFGGAVFLSLSEPKNKK
jgi:hypothetical protein